jgi:hypothetical protein
VNELSPDFAVEREVISNVQTLRSEDNAFLPLRRRQLTMRCIAALTYDGGEPCAK